MKLRVIVRLAAVLSLLLASAPAFAAKTQVNPESFKTSRTGIAYGRSDGVFQDTTSLGLWLIENGGSSKLLGKTFYEDFTKYGLAKGSACTDFDGSTCAGDATLIAGLLSFGDGLRLIQSPVATATLPVANIAAGLDITGDLTDNDGFEVFAGPLSGQTPFVIGDDPAFYECATIFITDVSGSDELVTGFRRAEVANAVNQNYLDYATIGSISGDIKTVTELNNGGAVVTDTTDNWADASSHKLCVYVSGAGVVTYKVDGSAPTTTVAFTFDDGDPVIPYVYLRHDSDIAEATSISKWEVGYTN